MDLSSYGGLSTSSVGAISASGVLCFWHGLEEIYQIHWGSCGFHVFGANEMHRFKTWLLQIFWQTTRAPHRSNNAEPYPWKLCRLLSRIFANVELSQIAKNFSRHAGIP